MAYWLFKSEPDSFSLDDLKRQRRSPWDGVRNYQARNYLRSMAPGDKVLFYHSRIDPPGVAGICRVVSEPYPDYTAHDLNSKYFDPKSTPEEPRWSLVEVEYLEHFSNFVSLDQLKKTPGLEQMVVTRKGSRLSITPVQPEEWEIVLRLGGVTQEPRAGV